MLKKGVMCKKNNIIVPRLHEIAMLIAISAKKILE